MPLFEVETDCHIIITWASDEDAATGGGQRSLSERPRDPPDQASPRYLGDLQSRPWASPAPATSAPPPAIAWPRPSGDKVHAIRLYMHETGTDLERARKVIESNMVMGW